MIQTATVKAEICETCGHHTVLLELPGNVYKDLCARTIPLRVGTQIQIKVPDYMIKDDQTNQTETKPLPPGDHS